MKTVFDEAVDEVAPELAPPRKPLRAQILGANARPSDARSSVGPDRRKAPLANVAASASSTVFSLLVWTLAGLSIALLLLAMNRVGSYKDLPTALQNTGSLRTIITSHVAASAPYFLGAMGALAAALGLLAMRVALDQLWGNPVRSYDAARKNWEAAYYCATDRIVFIRVLSSVHWDSVEQLQRLITRAGQRGPEA